MNPREYAARNARVRRYCEVYGIPVGEWAVITTERPMFPLFMWRAWSAWCYETDTRTTNSTPERIAAFDKWLRTYTPKEGPHEA